MSRKLPIVELLEEANREGMLDHIFVITRNSTNLICVELKGSNPPIRSSAIAILAQAFPSQFAVSANFQGFHGEIANAKKFFEREYNKCKFELG